MKSMHPLFARFCLLGLLLLTVSVAGTGWVLHSRASGAAHPGQATAPADGAAIASVACFGHVDVEEGITSLYPSQPGRVEQVNVKENQEVKAGVVLLSLDKRLAELLVKQARADLEAAQVQRDQAQKLIEQQQIKEAQQQAVLDACKFRLQAAEWLLARKEELSILQSNEKELDAARAQREELKAVRRGEEKKLAELRLNDPHQQVQRAEAEWSAKQARLDQALLALSECDLKAPRDGTVLRLFASPGDMLGSQPTRPAVFFCPKGPRVIRAEVDQEFAGRVAVGQEAVIHDDSRASAAWRGRVVRLSDWYTHRRSILQEPLQLNDVRTLECLIEVEPGHAPLRIGQRVRVMIEPGEP
jgi:multidrug resistance efflux pump